MFESTLIALAPILPELLSYGLSLITEGEEKQKEKQLMLTRKAKRIAAKQAAKAVRGGK